MGWAGAWKGLSTGSRSEPPAIAACPANRCSDDVAQESGAAALERERSMMARSQAAEAREARKQRVAAKRKRLPMS
jgi:hypothetical protein